MEEATKEILNYLGNTHTKVEKKEGFMGNYYSYLVDTIYLAEDIETKEVPSIAKGISKKTASLITLCHECIHSIQNKYIQLLNIILSNLSIVLTTVCVIVGLFWTNSLWFRIIVSLVVSASIVFRLILEIGATNNSTRLASEIVKKKIVAGVSEQEIQEGTRYIQKYKLVALLQMISDKILFLMLVLLIK